MEIKNTTKKRNPSLPFQQIQDKILDKGYELSLVFIGDTLSQKLNTQYKKINKPTDILTFPLSKSSGEIFINLNLAKKEAPKFNRNYTNFIGFLFIHGLMHLKGYEHSSKMEKEEEKVRDKFNI